LATFFSDVTKKGEGRKQKGEKMEGREKGEDQDKWVAKVKGWGKD
jgi:hypothetical protein